MIDTHCHLTFPDYDGRIPDVLREAREVGVTGCITISTTTVDCFHALRIARSHDRVWCTAGVHPLYSDKAPHRWEALKEVGCDPRCLAWGELGLDNHYPNPPRETQRRVLEAQIAAIESLAEAGMVKPVVLHCREAFADLIPILRASRLNPQRMVFHCFTGTPDDMRMIVDFGAWASFTGVLTYKNAQAVRDAAKILPIDRVMVETDAPFLSPEPHRAKRPNTPAMVTLVAKALAQVHSLGYDDTHARLNDNTSRFFGIPAEAA
ncbi:MAG: TatD family hydrolase [Planctomycetes bacterium]|nr:TatD family hydrolase [Planctomycetota bacterium]